MKTYLHLLENDESSQAVTEAGCTRVCKIPRSLSRCSSESDMALSGHCTVVLNPGSMTESPGEPKQNDTRTHWLKVFWGWRVESRHYSWLKSCLGNPDVKPRFRTTGKADSIKEKKNLIFIEIQWKTIYPLKFVWNFFVYKTLSSSWFNLLLETILWYKDQYAHSIDEEAEDHWAQKTRLRPSCTKMANQISQVQVQEAFLKQK